MVTPVSFTLKNVLDDTLHSTLNEEKNHPTLQNSKVFDLDLSFKAFCQLLKFQIYPFYIYRVTE